jgi:nucleoid-associated protein YgaU
VRRAYLVALALPFLLALLLYLAWCTWRPPVEVVPTLIISATPSDTPAPTTTPSPTATAVVIAVSPLPSETAVVTPTATDTATAVSTATPTAPPEPTATLEFWLVQRGEHLSGISEQLCGRQQWQWIYTANEDIIRNPNIIFAGQELAIPWPCPE